MKLARSSVSGGTDRPGAVHVARRIQVIPSIESVFSAISVAGGSTISSSTGLFDSSGGLAGHQYMDPKPGADVTSSR